MVDEIKITDIDEESRENLRIWIESAWDIFNEHIENGSNGEGLATEPTNPDPKD